MEISIRQMSKEDALAVTALTHQLGYSLPSDQILRNINGVMAQKDHDAFVALHGDKIVGWVGVAYSIQIENSPYGEVRGLVVDEQYRSHGIGRLLVEKAKQWAKEKGSDKLRLRCNVKRIETHAFYQHIGFKETKQQKVFEMEI